MFIYILKNISVLSFSLTTISKVVLYGPKAQTVNYIQHGVFFRSAIFYNLPSEGEHNKSSKLIYFCPEYFIILLAMVIIKSKCQLKAMWDI